MMEHRSTLSSGARVVVTGASSGIGAAIARLLVASGVVVFNVDRVAAVDDGCRFVATDLGDPASIAAALAAIEGPLDGLCNVAGVPTTRGAEAVARINYLGLRALTEGLLPRIKAGGAIVNIASTGGQGWRARLDDHLALARIPGFEAGLSWLEGRMPADETAYGYFKEALIVWTRSRGLELRDTARVRMNSISPGPIETPILHEFGRARGAEDWAAILARGGGAGNADDVAPAAVFLLSPAAAWITAADLPVDHGLAALMEFDAAKTASPTSAASPQERSAGASNGS